VVGLSGSLICLLCLFLDTFLDDDRLVFFLDQHVSDHKGLILDGLHVLLCLDACPIVFNPFSSSFGRIDLETLRLSLRTLSLGYQPRNTSCRLR
jgi:hypothetical protein